MKTNYAFRSFSVFLLLVSGLTLAGADVSTVKMPEPASRTQVRVGAEGIIHVVYADMKNRGDLLYIRQQAGQEGFSKPVKVNSTPHCAGGFNMALGKQGRVHVLIRPNARYSRDVLKRTPKFNDLKFMLYCRLNDEGTRFEKERDLSGDTFGFETAGAVIADGKGTVYVFWHGLTKPGPENTRQIFQAKSEDEGKTFTKAKPVHNNVIGACACCTIAGTIDADGRLYLGYRNSLEGGTKDSYLLISNDQGKTFTGKMLDPWPDAGCPDSIYSLTSGTSGVFVAWNTLGRAYFAKAGEESNKIAAQTTSKLSRRPVLASNSKGEMLFEWSEGSPRQLSRETADLAWQLYDKNGKPVSERKVLPAGVAKWSFPGVYAKPNGDFVIFYDGPGPTQ